MAATMGPGPIPASLTPWELGPVPEPQSPAFIHNALQLLELVF